MDDRDPPRLAGASSGEPALLLLGSALSDARATRPSAAALERVAAGLCAPVVAPELVSSTSSAGVQAGVKLLGAVIVAGVVGGGLWLAMREDSSGARARATEPATPTPQSMAAPAHVLPTEPLASGSDLAPPAPPAGDARGPASRERVERAPEGAASSNSPVATAAPAGVSEVELLARAQAALASDPVKALGLVEEHRRRFPSGALTQEREVIAVAALRKLGRRAEANERAGGFSKQFPDSAHRKRLEQR